MPGIKVFESLEEALAAGFAVYDRIPEGYLVRRADGMHWALAVALCKTTDLQSSAP
ncbi:MAG: hypothetical protein M3T49_00780 [Candidatus Eremiobacteraeota bacterium]|nr:hypothetical protein [Candidatus Eremiobacteraeota bacterium]